MEPILSKELNEKQISKEHQPWSCAHVCLLPLLFGMRENQKETKTQEKENENGQSWKSIQGRRWCGRSPICFSRCTCSRRYLPSMVSRTREGWTKGQGTVSNRLNEKWTMDLFGYKPSFWPFLIQFCYTRLCLPRNEGNIETALEMMAVFVANPG